MEIGEKYIVGRLGQQPMHIVDQTVDPQHAVLLRTGDDTYVLEDNDSRLGVTVFGIRIKRKTIKTDTPFFLGQYKTSVRQLLQDINSIDLEKIWEQYETEKRRWDRYTIWVNSIRMLTPVITLALAQIVGQNWMISIVVVIGVLLVSILAGEKVLSKKNIRMSELNSQIQTDYTCPYCHKFLGMTPYKVLRQKKYHTCGFPFK